MMKYVVLALVLFSLLADAKKHSEHSNHKKHKHTSNQFRTFILDEYRNREISLEAEELSGERLIRYVNREQDMWTARRHPRFDSYTVKNKLGLMGVDHIALSAEAKRNLAPSRFLDIAIPENFDSREQWPDCSSMSIIRDQSSCGSCWAFGAVEAMSDRICAASKGEIQVSLSADDLLSCCSSCGYGCQGGDPLHAWKYWVKTGIVTGGNFTAKTGCKPYPFPPCEHHSNKTHYDPCTGDLYPTPKCDKHCVAGYTERDYNSDKFYGKSAYGVADNVEAIQKEILTHGPVEVAFSVYDDFVNYAGGIYHHVGGKFHGGHAVKMLGWGVDNGTPYWLIANSWNEDWGEDGYFRILRGVDEVGIESGVVGGVPKLPSRFRRYTEDDTSENDEE